MNDLLTNLLKLQALEFNESAERSTPSKITELKGSIPQPILAHYERLVARGKKGVALVRNQVCTGCHMRLPIGTINTLMQGQDIQLCDTCGRYLCLPDPVEIQPLSSEAAAKPAQPASKPRKRKPLAATAV
jgi:predicted  nucleic acid-binding Zn-ribbon protein